MGNAHGAEQKAAWAVGLGVPFDPDQEENVSVDLEEKVGEDLE